MLVDGNLYAENCDYCGRGPDVIAHDCLRHYTCTLCWPAVRDALARWGDLRGLGRAVTEADRQVPRGAWTADSNASGDKAAIESAKGEKACTEKHTS